MRYSIIIPTYNKLEQTLKPCLESIIKYTDLVDTEVIVVANGCTDDTHQYVMDLGKIYPNIKLIWTIEPLGYTKAINKGLGISIGDYFVLLNNDTQILPSEKNQWLEILNKPFKDPTVGITGPMKVNSPQTEREFLIFFCVMLSRKCYKALGPLDEIFSPGYGEDTSYCHEAENAGFKVVQVPEEKQIYYGDKRMTGDFPIWHEGNVTFRNWPGGEELIAKNNKILEERYKYKTLFEKPFNLGEKKNLLLEKQVDISRALKCDGFMSSTELEYLAKQASQSKVIISVGEWHGRSTRAIADNMPKDGKFYAIDHWLGSESERHTNHASAAEDEGDAAFLEFCDNLFDHIQEGRVIPLRMTSKNAANFLKSKGILADFVFIDSGHEYHEVWEDIKNWQPLVKNGGMLAGHDYYHDGQIWQGVQRAVDEVFGHKGTNMGYIPNNSIWAHKIEYPAGYTTDSKKYIGSSGYRGMMGIWSPKPDIYDCFPFNSEMDILDRRFEELYDVVDRFVIVEATKTHSGNPKPLHFRDNLQRYEKYLSKVTHIIVDDYPEVSADTSITDKSWAIERHQRECIMRGLTDCKDNDIIIISDADEIPDKEAIEFYRDRNSGIMNLEMDLYYYNEQTKAKDKWLEAKICSYKDVKGMFPCGIRYSTSKVRTLPNAGNHLSYFGSVEQIIKKIEDTAHVEYSTDYFKDPDRIKKAIEEGSDIFGRKEVKFEKV